jgi:type II secretory pathway component PulM
MRNNKEARGRAQTQMTRAAREEIDLSQRLAFSPREAGVALGRSATTVYRLIYRGLLKPVANGGRLMISRVELDRYLGTATEYNPQRKAGSGADENGG